MGDGVEVAVETARAKINLSLRILGRRPDGYHDLRSLVVFAETGDRLTARPDAELSLTIEGPFASSLEGGGDNLVLRAARGLREIAGVASGAHITLEKNLPVASGIGGGSADAAAALRALMRLWNVAPDEAALERLALSLGADVPVCLGPRPALMCGIGERVSRLPRFPGVGLLLVNPLKSLSTASVFRALAAPAVNAAQPDMQLPDFSSLDDLLAWVSEEPNDLEAPAMAILPEIGSVLSSIAETKECRLARMSGSGATCFGIYRSVVDAEAAARMLSAFCPSWWVKATTVSGVNDYD